MKLRAITLAAAGLLAAASAQAELQTWRYSGLLMRTEGTLSASAVYGEYTELDLTFDLEAVATDDVFASALVGMKINGTSFTVGPNNLVPDLTNYASVLSAALHSSDLEGLTALQMKGVIGIDADTRIPRPVNSVGEFLSATDTAIDEYTDLLLADGATWQEVLQIDLVANSVPSFRLEHGTGGAQLYALIGAHNITPGVPEPSSWALALLGGVGAAALARRRQSARQPEALAA